MRRVLSVHHYPDFGGPHNEILTIDADLAALGFETVVLLPDQDGTASARLRGLVNIRTTRLHRLHRPPSIHSNLVAVASTWADITHIRAVIRESKPDLVRVHGTHNPHGAIAAWLEGVPVVWVVSNALSGYPRWIRWVGFLWPRLLASAVLANGRATVLAYPGARALERRTFVYYPGIDTDRFVPVDASARRACKEALGLSPNAPVVVSVGSVSPIKGTDVFLDVAEMVGVMVPGCQFVYVGGTTSRNLAFETQIRRSVHDRALAAVTFLGHRDDVEAVLAAADVALITSRSEGTTTTAGEAMSTGVPVVATDVGAVREVLPDGKAGYLEAVGRPDLLARRVAQLLADDGLRKRMAGIGRSVAVSRFSSREAAQRQARAYEFALREPRRTPRLRPDVHGAADAGRRATAEGTSSAGGLTTAPDEWDWPWLQCPQCRSPVMPSSSSVRWSCDTCGWTGSATDEVPILLPNPALATHDDLDHRRQEGHKAAQAAHFDRATEEEFEIVRPHGTPRLYRFLLSEKFRRAVSPIRLRLEGASALAVCGGSGMDAEFLSRAGAAVTTSDVSLGAAVRAKKRSDRYGLRIQSIVADVEQLPFADASVDLVAVHDGLHHLEDPYVGLSEMARVARRWVIVTEPSRASMTRLAIRLGFALDVEAAGNRVARMEPSEVAAFLEARGYSTLRAERYAMYYPHHPGAVSRLLSRRLIFSLVRVGWRLANVPLGRFGNKMVVVAERNQSARTASSARAGSRGSNT